MVNDAWTTNAAIWAQSRQQREIYYRQEAAKAEADPSYRPYFDANVRPLIEEEYRNDRRTRTYLKGLAAVVAVVAIPVVLVLLGFVGLFIYGAMHTSP